MAAAHEAPPLWQSAHFRVAQTTSTGPTTIRDLITTMEDSTLFLLAAAPLTLSAASPFHAQPYVGSNSSGVSSNFTSGTDSLNEHQTVVEI